MPQSEVQRTRTSEGRNAGIGRVPGTIACVMLGFVGLWLAATVLGWEVPRTEMGQRELAEAFLRRRTTAVGIGGVVAALWFLTAHQVWQRRPTAPYLLMLASVAGLVLVLVIARV